MNRGEAADLAADADGIIRQLVRIEEMALEVLEHANEHYRALPADIKSETSRRAAEVDGRAQDEIDALRRAAGVEVDGRVRETAAVSAREQAAVIAAFDKHGARWRRDIVARVTGGR